MGRTSASEQHRGGGIWSELTEHWQSGMVTTSNITKTPTTTSLSTPGVSGQCNILLDQEKSALACSSSSTTTSTEHNSNGPTHLTTTTTTCPSSQADIISDTVTQHIDSMSTDDHATHATSSQPSCSINENPSCLRAMFNGRETASSQGLPGSASPRSTASTGAITRTPPHLNRDIPTIMATDDSWRQSRTDTSSEVDQRSTNSMAKVEDSMAAVRRRVKKAIHRSRSDLTKRYSNSSDLSELSARFSRNSADLEKFFNEMGLDRSILEPMMMAQFPAISSSDLHLFESMSSLDSPEDHSFCSEDDITLQQQKVDLGLKSTNVVERTTGGHQTSIVERNARIIKWLCNVKKATSQEEDDV